MTYEMEKAAALQVYADFIARLVSGPDTVVTFPAKTAAAEPVEPATEVTLS
jgi:hypothetical protein